MERFYGPQTMTPLSRTHLQVAILRAKTDGFRTYERSLRRLYANLYGKQNSRLTGKEKGRKVRGVLCSGTQRAVE